MVTSIGIRNRKMNKEDLKDRLNEFKSEIPKWESQLKTFNPIERDALEKPMNYLFTLGDTLWLNAFTLEYDKEFLGPIQEDIEKLTSAYKDKLTSLQEVKNKHLDNKAKIALRDNITNIQLILSELLPPVSARVSRMEEVKSQVYDGPSMPKPEWKTLEGRARSSEMIKYLVELDKYYLEVKNEQKSSLTKEDGEGIKQEINTILEIIKEMDSEIMNQVRLTKKALQDAQEVISEKKGNIKEINNALPTEVKISHLLENIMSSVLSVISSVFNNINEMLPGTQQHTPRYDDLQRSKAQGRKASVHEDLYNHRREFKTEIKSQKELAANLQSELVKLERASQYFEGQMTDNTQDLNTLLDHINMVLALDGVTINKDDIKYDGDVSKDKTVKADSVGTSPKENSKGLGGVT